MSILIDLDGTLVFNDDNIFLQEAIRVFNCLGIYSNKDELKLSIKTESIFDFIDVKDREQIKKEFWSLYDPDCEPDPVLIPGAVEALERLKIAGNRLYLVTSRRVFEKDLRVLLKPFGFNDYFTKFYSQSPSLPANIDKVNLIGKCLKEVNIQVADAQFIGDSSVDMYSAKRCGIPTRIGVLSGGVEITTLESSGATQILNSIASI